MRYRNEAVISDLATGVPSNSSSMACNLRQEQDTAPLVQFSVPEKVGKAKIRTRKPLLIGFVVSLSIVAYLSSQVLFGWLIPGTFRGHVGKVDEVVTSPDGRTMASWSSADNTIRLWDTCASRERAIIPPHSGIIRLVFSPDGKILASWGDETIKLWDAITGDNLATLDGHDERVWSVAFSPDGKTLASASHARINLWVLHNGERRSIVNGASERLWCVAFSPDGKTLAWGSETAITLWDLKTSRERVAIPASKAYAHIELLVFTPDSKNLVWTYFGHPVIMVWDELTGEKRCLEYPPWMAQMDEPIVDSIAISADGKTLAANAEDTIGVWDLVSGKHLVAFERSESCASFVIRLGFGLRGVRRHVSSLAFTTSGKVMSLEMVGKTVVVSGFRLP